MSVQKIVRIGVISDTHRNPAGVLRALEVLGEIDRLMHLGDGVQDVQTIEALLDIPVYAVAGNCDYLGGYPYELTVELNGLTFFLTHGHFYHVRNSARLLIKNAVQNHVDVTLFGHTHISEVFAQGRHVFMNPGSITLPRGPNRTPTCGLITLEGKEIYPRLLTLESFS